MYIELSNAGEGEGWVPAGFDDEWVWVVGIFPRRDGKLGRGCASEIFIEV
jgi:hypothetical protein